MAQQKPNKTEAEFEAWSNEANLDELRKLVPKHHDWKQRGPMLVCKSCPNPHESYIGMDKQLVAVSEGKPILQDR